MSKAESNSQLAALFEAGRYLELEQSVRPLLKQEPMSGFYWKVLGAALQMQGKDALQALQHAAKLLPDDAQAYNNLGVALYKYAQFDGATACYQRALELQPDYAEAYSNLAAVLLDSGQIHAALDSCSKALALSPDFAQAHNNLANTLMLCGRLDEAVASYRRALIIQPDYAHAHLGLALAFRDLGQLEEAVASCHDALKCQVDYVDAYSNLGTIFQELNRLDEAMACHQKALDIEPDSCFTLVTLGRAHLEQGNFDEAEMLFRRALAIDPKMPEAWARLTRCRKMTNADLDWLASAEQSARECKEWRALAELYNAMGKFCDDIGRYDQAFGYFQRGNELKAKFFPTYDRCEREEYVAQRTRLFTPSVMRHSWPGASNSERPLFIVGMPRSGTSLIEQIIASHSATYGAGELRFWGQQGFKHLNASLADLGEQGISEIAASYLRQLERNSGSAHRVIDKMPGNFNYLGLINATFPNARIVHTQRNPIDTCLSIYFQYFGTGHHYANQLDDLAHYYRQYHALMTHWRAILPPEVFLEIPYEGLVDDQEGWSKRLIKFIGLEWQENCLAFHKNERRISTASHWQVRQPIYKSSKERWRHYENFVTPLLPLLDLDDAPRGGT